MWLWGQRARKSMGLNCEIAAKLNFGHRFRAQSHGAMKRHSLPLFFALALAACGGGGGASGSIPNAPPARCALLQNPPELLSTLKLSVLLTELELPLNQLLLASTSAPPSHIFSYQITY